MPGTRLDMPDGDMSEAAWLPDGWIYVVWAHDLASPSRIWRVAPARGAEPVNLPDAAGCRRTDYLLPHTLPDGRLGLARFCMMDNPEQDHFDLVAFDPASGRLEMLAPLGKNNPGAVSWRREMQSGYVSHGSGICDGFAPLTRQGLARFPGPVTLDGRTWRLDEQLFQSGNVDCTDQGRAGSALLTTDEQRLVFRASPQSQGKSGQARLDYPWNLYIQDLPDGKPRALVRGFSDTRGEAMAPDGRHLAIAGRRGKEQGLWLVDLHSGSMRKLAGVRFADPSFSSDGRQIAVVFARDEDHAQLRVLDVAEG